ncbi:hypothetical protein S1R3Y_000005 [Vibrio phage vB_ValP_VA-RY-3]|nr:hypothetical protein S1R3Y_000005 [Vibrio phage vB_ValP_VA-RY-3]
MPIYKASNGKYKIENVPGPGHDTYKQAAAQLKAIKASQARARKGKRNR